MDKYQNIEAYVRKYSIKGAVFDLDGTLVELPVDWEMLRKILKSTFQLPKEMGINEGLEYIKEKRKPQDLQRAHKIVQDIELESIKRMIKRKSILRLIRQFSENNIKIAIFSNNMKMTIDTVLEDLELKVDTIVAKDDVRKYKPDPEGLMKILSEWSLNNNEVIFIGNSYQDEMAGKKIEISTFLV